MFGWALFIFIFQCIFLFVYSVCACLSVRPPPLPPHPSCPFPLAVGDGGAAAQLDNHLLAVMEGPFVSQLLQGAGSVRKHAHPLARSRQEGGGKVAAGQHHGLCLLALARPHLTLLCRQREGGKKAIDCFFCFGVSSMRLSAMNSQSHWMDYSERLYRQMRSLLSHWQFLYNFVFF